MDNLATNQAALLLCSNVDLCFLGLRLLGIGRNQYIDLMNSNRSSRKFGFFRKKGNVDLLPTKPVENVIINPWWILQVGYVTEEDIKVRVSYNQNKIQVLL